MTTRKGQKISRIIVSITRPALLETNGGKTLKTRIITLGTSRNANLLKEGFSVAGIAFANFIHTPILNFKKKERNMFMNLKYDGEIVDLSH
jgi:hypothetical protein